MKKGTISFDAKSISINGERVILLGGEIHYFRIPHQLWEDRLLKLKNAGCNFVSIYIPWNWHEPEKGKELWEGDHDLDALLKLCEKHNLYVVAKPGPYINAEWDCGGFPHWVLYNIELEKLRVWNPEYLEIVKQWYTKIIRVLEPHLITKGGSIILFQVENEYDHLIELSKLKIPQEEACKYLMFHLNLARERGIDIPVFTNEGKLIRGTEIIETRTFYPDIPWLWKWCFKYFDQKIQDMIHTQPDKPVMIMELEAGWFAQFGQPLYEISPELPDAIIKDTFIQGASLFNIFMFAGGTTFPFWGCRGDINGVTPPGTGACTSYDFGNPPVREWGEISRKKYYNTRAMALFFSSFPGLLYNTKLYPEYTSFINGGEGVKVLYNNRSESDSQFLLSEKKIMALERVNDQNGLLFLRNLEDESKEVSIKYISPSDRSEKRFPVTGTFTLPGNSAFLFPLDIPVPDSNVVIRYSTSELLTCKKINGNTLFLLKGKEGSAGELKLDTKGAEVEVLQGKVGKEFNHSSVRLTYQHQDLIIIRTGNVLFLILNTDLAGRIWTGEDFLLIADVYFIRSFSAANGSIQIEAELAKGEKSTLRFFVPSLPVKICLDNRDLSFNYIKTGNLYQVYLDYQEENNRSVEIVWDPVWKYFADNKMKDELYDASQWQQITEPIALEKMGIYDHGYYWYRSVVELPEELSEVKMVLDTNGADRAGFYINGKFIWKGIGQAEPDISKLVRPGRNILAICYENSFHTKGHPGEGPIIKFSGLQTPIVIQGKTAGRDFTRIIKEFRIKEILSKGYYRTEFNDKGWNTLEAGEKYMGTAETGDYIWLRRKFRYMLKKDESAPLKLTIKKAVERCFIFLNDHPLGKYESIGPQNDFYIPESFLKEENTLTIFLEGPGHETPVLFEPVIEPYFQVRKRMIEIKL